MEKRIWRVMVLVVGGFCLAGCSSSSDGDSGGAAATGGTGMNDMAGTTGGTMMPTGTVGDGMGTVVKNIPCGEGFKCAAADPASAMNNPLGMMFMLGEVCCADEVEQICGTVNATTQACDAPPEVDADCPQAFGMPGCCAANNECGVDGSIVGRGCQSIGEVKAMFAGFPGGGGGFFMLPDETYCDGTPIPVVDAGMDGQDPVDAGMDGQDPVDAGMAGQDAGL